VFADGRLRPMVHDSDRAAAMSKDLIASFFDLGVMGIEVPDQWGGAGASFFTAVLVVEELSHVDASCGVLVDVQNTLVINALQCWASDELRRRYLPDDPSWVIEQGSVLDTEYLAGLGQFDIVYSWGVLHHTGAMWQAMGNLKPMVKPGGLLFIAIYNDCGEISRSWLQRKRRYNALPPVLRPFYVIYVWTPHELRSLAGSIRSGEFRTYIRELTSTSSVRGKAASGWDAAPGRASNRRPRGASRTTRPPAPRADSPSRRW